MIITIYLVFIIFIIIFNLIAVKKQLSKNKESIRMKRKPHVNNYSKTGHEDHTRPLPHNAQASFKRNNEKDVVKDPPLSEAEKNVLYGR
ncbi:MAG: hypothetical protein IJO78_02690 [Erysipelotrichaceae bacterium]|nr:hypothetical protein [Erysipelotrichaceae bacterium]MBQ9840482.1 hypothetical protein [Erysipelotrichaceae bacterium]